MMKRSSPRHARQTIIVPANYLVEAIVPDATPGMISRFALSDEQLLLAKIRSNRLIDHFTGFICYSLQTHLRTTIRGIGQVETDEIYIGIDKRGELYIVTVHAISKNKKDGTTRIEQDIAVCASKFPGLIAHNIAAQFIGNNRIALIELDQTKEGIRIASEKHYKLVSPEELLPEDLQKYQKQPL